MKRTMELLGFCLILCLFLGCSAKKERTTVELSVTPAIAAKIKVIDVSNRTKELFDVDVIGLLWSSLDKNLAQRGMLWTEKAPSPPLLLEASILKYQKGNIFMRALLPPWGNTLLVVKCDLKDDGGRVMATVETKHTLTAASDPLTLDAYRKIFDDAAEDIVSELVRRL